MDYTFVFMIVIVYIVLRMLEKWGRIFLKYILRENDQKHHTENRLDTAFQDHLPQKIILADTVSKCENAVQIIQEFSPDGVFGFDSEWAKGGLVSLVQVAAYNGVSGMCVLFCLGKIGHVPDKLKGFLSQRNMLKLGVAVLEDGKKISKDYGCLVLGTLDLRMLAHRLNLECPKGLAAICWDFLHIKMDKTLRVSDWDAKILTDAQIKYAAFDAYAAVLIYHKMLKKAVEKRNYFKSIMMMTGIYNADPDEKAHNLPHGVIDRGYKTVSEKKKTPNIESYKSMESNKPPSKNIGNPRLLPTRSRPLYDNCYMQCPDGELLSLLDRKKAAWYISNDLAYVVEEDPFTVRLKFEPSGRAVGEVGQYYIQKQVHQCAVCGSKKDFIRKNVIPKEYRKHFPDVMKVHQSHDILLLCQRCHAMSNTQDDQLRKELAKTCDAPIQKTTKPRYCQRAKEVVELLMDPLISSEIREKLETHLKAMTRHSEVTPELIQDLHEYYKSESYLNNLNQNSEEASHGSKVVEFFKKNGKGLTELEKLWRTHFVTTMDPQFLPEFWSVNHNYERLTIRKTENRIDPKDAELAGL